MSMEKAVDQYIGDIVGGLVREAAMLKAKCAFLEAQVESLKAQVPKVEPEHYVHQEPTI